MTTSEGPAASPSPPSEPEAPLLSGGLIVVLAAAAAVGALFVWTRVAEQGRAERAPAVPIVVTTEAKHRVTPEMERASATIAGAAVPDVRLEASDGTARSLREVAAVGAPVALVFIKDGCPCSESAQPYYNRLHSAYGGKATFLGVIDRDAAGARAWGEKYRASFPILADPGLGLMRAFGATNSAFFALVDRNAVVRMWPGYSVGMLEEAGAELGRATGLGAKPIDTSDAPENPYSGCPYELEDGPTGGGNAPSPGASGP